LLITQIEMASSHGRYQSHVLNFLSTQTQKIIEQCDRAFRQVKNVTVGVAQIILYPIYLLMQTSRLTGKQLRQTVANFIPQLAPEVKEETSKTQESDRAIERVLTGVQNLSQNKIEQTPETLSPSENTLSELVTQARNNVSSTDTETSQTLTAKRPVIRGVASQIRDRALVLTSIDNEIINNLTSQQQEKLHQRIMGEITNYWSQRVFNKTKHIPLLPNVNNSENILPPVRVFWQIMGWVQTSPIAVAANFFGEASLLESQETFTKEIENLYLCPSPHSPISPSTWLDRALTSLREVSKKTFSLLPTKGFTLNISNNTDTDVIINTSVEPERLQEIMKAAIVHFFGNNPGNNPLEGRVEGRENNPYLEYACERLQLIRDSESDDPWLRETDLFGEPAHWGVKDTPPEEWVNFYTKGRPGTEENTRKLLPSSKPENPFSKLVKTYIQPLISTKETTPTEVSKDTETGLSIRKEQKTITSQTRPLVLSSPQSQGVEAKPNWLEAQATAIGYVKHPLEVILEWLDRVMVWLEEKILKVWQWVKSLWAKE
jgi:hypothetical protein